MAVRSTLVVQDLLENLTINDSAFWSNGPNWPDGGEIDIVEGVSDYTNNQATIHTKVGCSIPSTSQNVLAITGNVICLTDCAAATTGNQGCGIRSTSSNSFGAGFNANGGGIYASQFQCLINIACR